MLSAHLEDQFRERLGDRNTADRDDSIRFAVDFTRMLAHIVPDDVDEHGVQAMGDALRARTDLVKDEIDGLLDEVQSLRARVNELESRAGTKPPLERPLEPAEAEAGGDEAAAALDNPQGKC